MPPPAAPSEGQKSIMSFFKKVDPTGLPPAAGDKTAPAGGAGAGAGALDASAASAAATPPPSSARRKAPPAAAAAAAPSRGTPGAGAAERAGARKPGASGRGAKTASGRAQGAGAASRPSRASKNRAQEKLKEREYSSDSLMEESEESAGEAEESGAEQTLQPGADVAANTPASVSPPRFKRKVRFSIPGDDGALEEAVGGTISPIALDDEEVVCVGDEIDTEQQEAKREVRLRASLEAVEGELGSLQYGKRAGKRDLSSCAAAGESADADPAHRKRRASVLETPKVLASVRPELVRVLACVRCCSCLQQDGVSDARAHACQLPAHMHDFRATCPRRRRSRMPPARRRAQRRGAVTRKGAPDPETQLLRGDRQGARVTPAVPSTGRRHRKLGRRASRIRATKETFSIA